MNSITKSIEKLKTLIKAESMKATFHPSIKSEKIRHFEKENHLRLPKDYAVFLTHFNGGLITEFDWPFYIDMTEDEADSPKQSSFYFFDWEEVQYHYSQLIRHNQEMIKAGGNSVFSFIPIGRTPEQKLLLVMADKERKESSPLIIASDNDLQSGVSSIAESFTLFLEHYIENKGFPSTKAMKEVSLQSYLGGD